MGIVQAKGIENEKEDRPKVDLSGIKGKVQRIHVDGLGRTKEDIVIRSVKDVFMASDFQNVILKVNEARMKLEDLGCFENVGVLVDTFQGEGARADGIEVTFEVKEISRIGAKFNTAVGNNEGSVSSGAEVRNLFGRGEFLTSEYSYGSKKTSSFNTSFSKPLHDDNNTRLSTSIYQQACEIPWSGYKEIDRGGLFAVNFSSAEDVDHRLVLSSVWRQLNCLSKSTAFAVREQCGHSLKNFVRHELTVDKRDDFIFPSDGNCFVMKNEFAGLGGDVGYIKNEMDLQVNLPLVYGVVVQGSFRAGHLKPLRSHLKNFSVADLFVLGGPTSLRGFEMGGVGPHSDGSSLGAKMFWESALHFYSPLPLLKRGGSYSEKFKLHAFVNTGNIGDFEIGNDYKEDMKKLVHHLRLSYGLGLAMNLGGIARVELNYCIPLMLQRGDRPCNGVQLGVSTNFL